jgi:hypothetical protein
MASTHATQEPYRELAHRENDGLEVILFWDQNTDELTVTVSDARNGAHFELAAKPDQALDVFNHPYAHAAFQGLTYQEASLASSTDAVTTDREVVTERSDESNR